MIKLNAKSNNIIKLINIETASINAAIASQKSFSKQILTFLKNFMSNIETDSIFLDEINKFLADTSFYLTKINSNISLYNSLLKMLNDIKSNCSQIEYEATVNNANEYNEKYKSFSNEILRNNYDIEGFINHMTSIDISEYISMEEFEDTLNPSSKEVSNNCSSNIDTDKIMIEKCNNSKNSMKVEQGISSNIADVATKPEVSDVKSENYSLVENTLTISEVTGLVTLPYKISDLKEFLNKEPDKYTSLSDVVLSKYTVPIRNYKFSAIARFREAYNLIIEREHGTKKQAINLATELFSNYNLHPAIITACRDLNELDVYLSCLEFNELEDFHFFNIVYDVLPVQVRTKHALLNG